MKSDGRARSRLIPILAALIIAAAPLAFLGCSGGGAGTDAGADSAPAGTASVSGATGTWDAGPGTGGGDGGTDGGTPSGTPDGAAGESMVGEAGSLPETPKISEVGNFEIRDGRVYDPAGNEFIAIGTNVNGPRGFFTRDTLSDVGLMVDVWRFNCVRLITTFGIQWQQGANTDLDAIVAAFTSRGVVVMIECHDYTGVYPDGNEYRNPRGDAVRYSLDDFTAKWVEWAERYMDNPYVWINIMNEPSGNTAGDGPGWPGWSGSLREDCETWHAVHRHVIEALRGCGFENVIVLDENHYGQGAYDPGDPDGYGSAILNVGPKLNAEYGNLLYSLHPYGWSQPGRIGRFAADCRERGIALIFGEYGAAYGDLNTHKSAMELYEAALTHGVGRLYWSWQGDVFCLTDKAIPGVVDGGGYEADRTDGERPGNLSWFGGLVWDDTRGALKLPLERFTFPTVFNGDFSLGTAGWWNIGGTPMTRLAGGSHDGSYCGRLRPGYGYSGQELDAVNLKPNGVYEFGAWGRCEPGTTGADGRSEIGLRYRATADSPEETLTLSFHSGEWERLELTLTMPETVYSARIFIWQSDPSIDFMFDGISLTFLG
ncbi:MAG: cellulase family glycosylhydrolase [Oscillospiraceae bacterium]|nr:cellulase family glycosylhydrolase [Oscillospiraceae bacterium]